MIAYEHIVLDVSSAERKTIFAKQSDANSRNITVRMTDHGVTILGGTGDSAVFGFCRPDGVARAYKGTIMDDGTILICLPAWALEVAGPATCDVALIGQDSTGEAVRLGTAVFNVKIGAAACPSDSLSTDGRLDILADMIAEVAALHNAAETVAGAQAAADAANAAAAAANAAATGAVMVGATANADGTPGIVPKPTKADAEKVLGGDGQWHEMTAAGHTQSASTITAGTLGGKVLANATAIAANDSQLRNIRIVTDDITVGVTEIPAGEIWIKI